MNPLVGVVVWVVAVAVQFLLFPVVVAVVTVAGLGYAGSIAIAQAWRVFTVGALAGPSEVAVPPRSTPAPVAGSFAEPAYPSYFLTQVWLDLWVLTRRSAVQVWRRGYDGYTKLWSYLVDNAVVPLFGWPTLFALVVGTVLLLVPIAVGLAALAVVQAITVAVVALGWLVVVGLLSAIEYAQRLVRRIVVACPHPGCYQRFGLPVYACPSCGERHRRLVPNRFGALRHTCRCGARLPTLVLLGRYRLAAQCPHCTLPLPGRIGRVRVEHLPIVGGPDAGKSTFLCLSVAALRGEVEQRGGSASFVDARDDRSITDGLAQLRRGDRLVKTGVVLPRAVMVDIRPARADGRILYFFDPAGEYYAGREIDSQRYLDHAGCALVVVDPLAIPGVWQAFTVADKQFIADSAPSNQAGAVRENAGDVVDRLMAALYGRPAGARLDRLLIVVTKTDVLRRTSVGAALGQVGPGGAGVAEWLEQVGWGNWMRALAGCATEVGYTASALDLSEFDLAGPVAWLCGIDLPAVVSPRSARLRPAPLPWAAAGRPDRLPVGHRVGRIAVFGLVVASMLALGAGTIWYALNTINGIYG